MTKSRARKFADIMGGTFVGLIEDGQIDIVDVDGLSAIQTKVNGIEANATTDQTAAEIKTAYESNSNTNEFSDAEQTKLNAIEASANRITNTNELTNGAGFITVSEVPVVDATEIIEGDSRVTVVDSGSGGKVLVRLDNTQVSEFNAGAFVLPKGATSGRNSSPVLGEIRYNTLTTYLEVYTAGGWASLAPPPTITSISPSSFSGAANTPFTVNGTFFDSGTVAQFVGSSGATYSSGTTTFVNSGQLTVTNGVNLPAGDEPYKIQLTTGTGGQTTSTQQIDAGSVPAFSTPAGSIGSFSYSSAISTQVTASDADTSIDQYSLTTGALPSGLSLNSSTGAITGTASAGATTTYTFTVQARDTYGDTNTRQFSITIANNPPSWTSPTVGATVNGTYNVASTIALSATDPENAPVSFSGVTLPAGFTLSGSTLSYNTSSTGNKSVTLRASDGFNTTDNTFTVVIPSAHVLQTNSWQTSWNNSGVSWPANATGASLFSGTNNYSNLNTSLSFANGNVTGYWTFYMPVAHTARITCSGARAGGANNSYAHSVLGGGRGRTVTADVTMGIGYYTIVIGKRGGSYVNAQGGGGGGGTFFFSGRRADSNLVTLVAAGGGGGGNSATGSFSEMDGRTVTFNGAGGGYGGGTNGNGGTTGSGSEEGASGSGVFTTGTGHSNVVGQSIINGDGRGNTGSYYSNGGGFGGAAAGWGGAGGGGGYSGGGAKSINTTNTRCSAGGGGSYIHPTLATLVSDGTLSDDGQFSILFN